MNIDYRKLNVVVSGGTGSLGQEVVQLLLEAGAHCYIPCFDEEELERFDLKKEAGVHIQASLNLTHEKTVEEYYGQLPAIWASIHCAGGFAPGSIEQTRASDFKALLEQNLTTCFLCCRQAVFRFREEKKGGRIVNVSAGAALEPRTGAGLSAYCVSKAGVAALTQSLGEELADERIWVNAVAPSIIDTPVNRRAMPEADFDRWPTPREIAHTIVFLASPQNQSTRGAVVAVYGRSSF